MEIVNIVIKPPNEEGNWIVTKIMKSNNMFNTAGAEEEVFRISDRNLEQEIQKTKNK